MKDFFTDVLFRLKTVQGELSTTEFARRCGIPQQTMDNQIRGARRTSIEVVAAVARAFGVSADWLLGLTDERVPRGGKPSVTASGAGAVAAGGSMKNVRTAPQECPRCVDKDATIAAQAETIRMQAETISRLITNK